MDCQKLHQEITELGHKYDEVESQYEKAEESGRGEDLKKALLSFDETTDELLEKYLPDFQGQFGDEVGIRGAHIERNIIKGLGDIITATPWGDNLAITGEGVFFIVEDENGGLSRGELIITGEYALGVFPMSEKKLLLPTPGRIDVIKKEGGRYSLCETLGTDEYGEIDDVIAMSDHRWIVCTRDGVHVLDENANGHIVFRKKIDLAMYGGRLGHLNFFPLSNKELIIGDYVNGGSRIFTIDDIGECSYVTSVPTDSLLDYVLDAKTISDDKWLITRLEGYSFLYRNRDQFRFSESIDKILGMEDFHRISHLSGNDFLVEDNSSRIFVFTLRSDGNLEKKGKLFDEGEKTPCAQSVISLTNDVWLMSRQKLDEVELRYTGLSRNYIIRRRKDGEIELGKEIEGLDFGVNDAIPIFDDKFLLLDGEIAWNEPLKGTHVQAVLDFPNTFKNVEILKDKLDLIIEAENK